MSIACGGVSSAPPQRDVGDVTSLNGGARTTKVDDENGQADNEGDQENDKDRDVKKEGDVEEGCTTRAAR